MATYRELAEQEIQEAREAAADRLARLVEGRQPTTEELVSALQDYGDALGSIVLNLATAVDQLRAGQALQAQALQKIAQRLL